MIVAAWAVRAVLSVVYAPMRMLHRRHKVTFISRQGNSLHRFHSIGQSALARRSFRGDHRVDL